jgi:hypothetical protein
MLQPAQPHSRKQCGAHGRNEPIVGNGQQRADRPILLPWSGRKSSGAITKFGDLRSGLRPI